MEGIKQTENMEKLLLYYYEGTISEEDARLVETWLKASSAHRELAQQIQSLTLATDTAQVLPKLHTKEILDDTHHQMDKTVEKKKVQGIGRYKVLFGWMQRIAAILFLPLLITVCFLYMGGDESKQVEMVEVKTNPGMTTTVTLPDNTVVTLNSSSSLQYPSSFVGEERKVSLEGEAFFSVTKDETKRFVVKTLDNSQITVYGTEFNVEAYRENGSVQTTLVSGKVDFSFLNKSRKYILPIKPGQKAIYNIEQKQVAVKEVNVDAVTSWKDGHLIFKDTPFEEVLESLGKRYNVTFVIKNEALKKHSFTTTFEKQHLDRILEIFRISSNIHFNYVEDGNNTERQIIQVY